jgi:hypothetical protein
MMLEKTAALFWGIGATVACGLAPITCPPRVELGNAKALPGLVKALGINLL